MNEEGAVSQKRILLADDHEEVREAIKCLLDVDQHEVAEANNGEEALKLFSPGRFDLVITDYAMPRMKGDELARNVKQLAPSQPVVMITGSARLSEDFKNAVDVVLRKPFSFSDLRQAIAKLC